MPLKSKTCLLRQDIEYLRQEEMKNRRKLRLLQVRQQNKDLAAKIRQKVQKNKCDEIRKLAFQLDQKHQRELDEKIQKAEKFYLEGLDNFGCAHANVEKEEIKQKEMINYEATNSKIAISRHKDAVKELNIMKQKKNNEDAAAITRRINIKNREKLRAKKVANLPNTNVTVSTESTNVPKSKSIITHSSMNQTITQSALYSAAVRHDEKYDAKAAAEDEEKLLHGFSREKSCVSLAMKEKARIRHLAAINQERLNRDLAGLEKEIFMLKRKENFRK